MNSIIFGKTIKELACIHKLLGLPTEMSPGRVVQDKPMQPAAVYQGTGLAQ